MGSLADSFQFDTPALKSGHENYVNRSRQWTRLVDELTTPSCNFEMFIDEALAARRGMVADFPQRAVVIGETASALLAVLMLRLRGLESIFVDVASGTETPGSVEGEIRNAPSGHRITRSILTSLSEDVGASYVNGWNIPMARVFQELGPFDLILACGVGSGDIPKALLGLSEGGVLIETPEGAETTHIYKAEPATCFVYKSEIQIAPSKSTRDLGLWTARKLALADIEYPGWLGKFLEFLREENFILASL